MNFSLYNTPGSNGNYPVTELQTGSVLAAGNGVSTPCLDSAGNTGSLSPEQPLCVTYLTWVGLMHQAKLSLTNDFETYFLDVGLQSDPGYATIPGSSTQCQGGIGAAACIALYRAPYTSAFIDFLSGISGTNQFIINVTPGTGTVKLVGNGTGTVRF